MAGKNTVALSLTIDGKVFNRLSEIADPIGKTPRDLIYRAIEEYLASREGTVK